MGEEAAGGHNSRVYTKLALCGQGSRDTGGQGERGREATSTRLLCVSFNPSCFWNKVSHNKVLLAANGGVNAPTHTNANARVFARVSAQSSNSASLCTKEPIGRSNHADDRVFYSLAFLFYFPSV